MRLCVFDVRKNCFLRLLSLVYKSSEVTTVTPYRLRYTFVSIVKTLPRGMVKESLYRWTLSLSISYALSGDHTEIKTANILVFFLVFFEFTAYNQDNIRFFSIKK